MVYVLELGAGWFEVVSENIYLVNVEHKATLTVWYYVDCKDWIGWYSVVCVVWLEKGWYDVVRLKTDWYWVVELPQNHDAILDFCQKLYTY